MEQIKLISVTAVLTVLIWATANQLVSETAEIDVTIHPEPAEGSGMIVATEPPGLERFRLTVTGPKRVVEQVRDEARSDLLGVLRIPVAARPNGQHTVDVRDALLDYRDQLRGLRIDRVSPAQVTIVIDHLQTVTMPVVLDGGSLLEFVVPPTADPPEVQVTIPESALARLSSQRVPLNVAELLANADPGEPQEHSGVRLPLKLAGAEVQIEPPVVTVRATVRQKSKTGTIPSVPINVQVSIGTFNRIRIATRDDRDLVTRSIEVRGPPKVVDDLVAGRIPVTGRIKVTGDLVGEPGEYVELEPVFDLPPGVTLARPVPPVEVRLERDTQTDR